MPDQKDKFLQGEPEGSFADAMKGITPLKQDKIHFGKANGKQNKALSANNLLNHKSENNKQSSIEKNRFHFSDEYEPLMESEGTLSYVKDGYPSYYAKLLRRGDVRPEIILDLHGYNKDMAKIDLADLIENCKQNHIPCACVVHGVSGGILKRKIPLVCKQYC